MSFKKKSLKLSILTNFLNAENWKEFPELLSKEKIIF